MSDNSPEYSSMKRTRVACETCRRKKIKCSGSNPCSNCQQSKETECVYIEKLRKKSHHDKSISKRSSTFKAVKTLEHKLSRLEGFMMDMSEKLDYMAGLGSGSKSNTLKGGLKDNDNSTDSSESGSSDYEEDEYTDEADLNDQEEDDQKRPDFADTEYGKNGHHQIKTVHETTDKYGIISKLSELSRKGKRNSNRKSYTIYNMRQTFFETHSFFSVCSPRSLQWISRSLAPSKKKVLDQFNKFPYFLYTRSNKFLAKWTDPVLITPENKTRLLERPLPEDRALAFSLLEHCKPQMVFEEYLISPESTRVLFDRYYKKEKMLASELLILCSLMYIFIGASLDEREGNIESDNRQISLCNTPTLDAYGEDDLIKLQSQFLVSSIHYYQKVSVMSEGVSTVQAILLFIIYLELTLVKSTANYILAAVAVRFAQEIGLHRCESFEGLPIEEVAFRRKLWWFCEYLDIEICYRHGKPPLINPADVSTLTRKDFISGSTVKNLPFNINTDNHLDPKLLKFLLEEKGLDVYFGHFMSLLNRLRFEAYSKLFSASSCDHSFTDIIYILTSMNKKMWELGSSMSPELRPRFYNDSEFGNSALFQNKTIEDGQLVMLLSFHLAFFTQLMTMNRLITRLKCDPHEIEIKNSEAIYLRDLASDSARTIVHITLRTVRNTISASNLSWLIFYSSAAVLDILQSCLNKPKSEDTVSDMELLIDGMINCSVKQLFRNPPKNGEMFNQIDSVMCLVTFIMLQMGIRIVESQSKRVFFDNNPYLIQISNHFMALFPELYQKKRADPILRAEIVNPATQSDRSSTASDLIGDSKSNFTATTAPSTDSTGNSMNSFGEVSPMGCPGLIPGPTGYLSVHDPKNPLINSVWDSKVSPNYGNSPSPSTYFSGKIPLGDPEFNEALDRVFGGGTPNFFYDNSIGL
ncbi:hypothetical protein CANTEDRAFT_123411 [Yamadazyma tenuis ATCC 10573]|uniref:Zn(2)-C6 fungal-type domain-containing protein n=1 Tax=Candida tenuis (strain ATCC 10573 / BCRC 21748 / CBS 615 / JCM 9827 / NBRC 10315 / NRRL Y-1498 / VKM Y-70) TaxID=590646 RepID=G3B5V3_CANTC|nr:uncharacterized protein CANTEDRAFT_123411 [Yamadazyma tenuis ATCC 10573]EGV63313.1 hypothetical protein CANTEDRAFT_123411 [Yamadazyma tenuis ATCC 10573]